MDCGEDDNAAGEMLFAGCGEKGAKVLEIKLGVVEFGLNSVQLAVNGFRNQIDTGIRARIMVKALDRFGPPLMPMPHLPRIQIGVIRLACQVEFDQPFEIGALLAFSFCGGAEQIQKVAERAFRKIQLLSSHAQTIQKMI